MLTMRNSELISQIRMMQRQEKSASYRCTDYISSPCNTIFSSMDRHVLCEWGFNSIGAFSGISCTTVVHAISYFDRFLGSSTLIANRVMSNINHIQLAFVACLVVALKVKAGLNVETEFVSRVVCRNRYSTQEINAMEMEVLQALSWKLNGPTAHDFIDYFFEDMPYFDEDGVQKDIVVQLSKALVELALREYKVAFQLPSQIAFGAITCALDYAEPSSSSRSLAHLYEISGYDPNDAELRDVLGKIRFLAMITLNSLRTGRDRRATATGRYQNNDNDADSVSSESSPRSIADF